MILPLKCNYRCLGFVAIMALLCLPTSRAEPAGEAVSVKYTTEQQAMLHALNSQLTRFEVLLNKDKNVSHAASVRASLEALKQRRDAFSRLAFDQSKYEELRFDLNVAYQRLNLWFAPPLVPKGESKMSVANSAQHKKAGE